MEYQINLDTSREVKLSADDEQLIVNYVVDCKKKGRDARKRYQDDWTACERAYHCEPDPINDEELEWQSNKCLPWAYDSVESWYAHMHSTLIPRNDKIFTVSGKTREDDPGAEVMQDYLEFRFDRNKFPEQFGKALKQLGIKNHTCVKLFWKEDKRVSYQWEPVTELDADGNLVEKKVRVPQEYTTFNNVWMDVVDIENFVMYPIHGDINRTTRIHTTFRFLEELKADAEAGNTPYFNINKLDLKDEKDCADDQRPVTPANTEKISKRAEKTFQGLKIDEAWIHRVKIGDKVYKNYIATIVNEKTLIRFQPNPYDQGESPFIWLALKPDGDCLYGYGLNSKGIQILQAANYLFNHNLDELKIKLHPPHLYWDDGVFNPYNVVTRPGAMVRMAGADSVQANMRPLYQTFEPNQAAMVAIEALKVEFETVTVPKVVKGLIETRTGGTTATEIAQAQNNSSGKMHVDAFHVNENLLLRIMERTYSLIHQQLFVDPSILEEIARVTQEAAETITEDPTTGEPLPPEQYITVEKPIEALVEELPQFLPLPEVDIKVVGYQNQIRKQEQLAATSEVLGQLAQSPAAMFIKWDGVAEQACELADLDKDRILMSQDERRETQRQQEQQAEQQQQMVQMIEGEKMALDRLKEEGKLEIDRMKVALQELDIRLKYGLQARQQEQQAEQFDMQQLSDKEQVA